MIQKYVDIFMEIKPLLADKLKLNPPDSYDELVRMLLEGINRKIEKDYNKFDLKKIHKIDDGDYQGTLLYLVPYDAYQPDTYYMLKVAYGSCSGCDTLQDIRSYGSGLPTKEQIKDYLTLMLHLVQGMKEV